ncbi:hypothetical protein CAI21_13770 [Alkalilimnicola ehrlichii]|uniref:DUF2946 domain-containing protein n=1 Tax=Alkalilimnicola ehrlichii TaxID=351052 RepID=A0A3E0WQE6_9GAMM|nr:hypothetical protein [Alkalilimnicola ehrlichii]RFA27981.1 hypothetical protein CAI21_13770 [Alkalilimnicola ehrlichii]RFA34629.1 hypothetical protein CAL65_14800 [Alkalilimnicola ehrlichii]
MQGLPRQIHRRQTLARRLIAVLLILPFLLPPALCISVSQANPLFALNGALCSELGGRTAEVSYEDLLAEHTLEYDDSGSCPACAAMPGIAGSSAALGNPQVALPLARAPTAHGFSAASFLLPRPRDPPSPLAIG